MIDFFDFLRKNTKKIFYNDKEVRNSAEGKCTLASTNIISFASLDRRIEERICLFRHQLKKTVFKTWLSGVFRWSSKQGDIDRKEG
jgi:hypothetical protein